LCQQNLPKEQRGLPALDNYIILVNPFPIFPEHLTIPHINHIDQLIEDKFDDMLDMAKLLEDFTVFYNGPKCGASAPDHFHFQAGIKRVMPIERDYRNGSFFHFSKSLNGVEVIKWTDYIRTILTLSGRDKDQITSLFNTLFTELKKMQSDEAEPLLNILTSYLGSRWTVHIFPRQLHRPWQYFEKGEKQIVLSPASVDMGGVLITPREEDYNKLSMGDAQDILEQVCLDDSKFQEIIKRLF